MTTSSFTAPWARLLRRLVLIATLLAATGGVWAQAATVTFFHNDMAGTPVLATNASGSAVWKENYLPYGYRQQADAASAGNRLWYMGKPYDPATGLAYMGARYYMPLLGRFTGMDPKEVMPEQPHSFNRYAYANNNPYRYVDPDGKIAETVWDAFSLSLGFQSLVGNVRAGNWSGAAIDGAGVAVDAVAAALPGVPGGVGAGIAAYRGSALAGKGMSKADAVIAETLAGKGNLTSATKLSSTELLQAGEKFLGPNYKEIGKPGSGVFRSADGTRQFRIDGSSLSGSHAPGMPHGHLETYSPGAVKPTTNNHIPFFD